MVVSRNAPVIGRIATRCLNDGIEKHVPAFRLLHLEEPWTEPYVGVGAGNDGREQIANSLGDSALSDPGTDREIDAERR